MSDQNRQSLFRMSGLPDAFGVVLLTICLAFLLSPYIGGMKVGNLNIPQFSEPTAPTVKIFGPLLFLALVFSYLPIWPIRKAPSAAAPLSAHSVSMGRPKYVTDSIAGHTVGFTIANPLNSSSIRITDIGLRTAQHQMYTAAIEERFELSDVVLGKDPGRHQIAVDLATSKSIFHGDKVIRIDPNDAASFRVSFFADAGYASGEFALSITYIDGYGEKRLLPSDGVYSARKSFGTDSMLDIAATPFKTVCDWLKEQRCSVLYLLPIFDESDFEGLDVFGILMSIQESRKCSDWGVDELIALIGVYTNTQARMDATLEVIKKLDDVANFDSKYSFICNLVRRRDERVVPYALALLPKIKIRRELHAPGMNPYMMLFGLQDMLEDELGIKTSACQEALES